MTDGHIRLWGRPLIAGCDAETAFWHAVTGGVGWSASRWLDLGRCEIMGRAWDVLERLAAGDPRACFWRERGGSATPAAPSWSRRST